MGKHMFFGSIVGSDYYTTPLYRKPRNDPLTDRPLHQNRYTKANRGLGHTKANRDLDAP